MLKYILTAVIAFCPLWSGAEPWRPQYSADNPYNLIPTLNNGKVGGNGYVTEITTWRDAICDTTRTNKSVPRFAEFAARYKLAFVSNAFWLEAPMPPNQIEKIKAKAAAWPDNKQLANQADTTSFEQGCAELRARGIAVGQKTGGPWRYERLPGETIPAWAHRLDAEFAPILAHCDFVVFDNTMGANPYHGEWTAAAVRHYLAHLQRKYPNLLILGEPVWWEKDREWCEGFGSFLSHDFWGSTQFRNPEATTTWAARKPSGEFPGDPSPMLIPGITGTPVFIWLDFKTTSLFEGDPKKEPLRYIQEMHARWPHAWLCCPFGWIPRELVN